ncbi:MAG: hypothetical protein AAF402_16180 [Pseudomonadota bacterium]
MCDSQRQKRRSALIRIAGLSGAAAGASQIAPAKWQAPVIDSIVLPAHATTTPPSGPSPFAGTYSVNLSNPGNFEGNCTDTSTLIPTSAEVIVNMDGSIELFGVQFNGIVAPDGTINSSVSIPVNGTDDGDCTIVNSATGSIVGGVISGSLTSTQTCTEGCIVQVSTDFDGMQIS